MADPILDESSLVLCSTHSPGERIECLAQTMKALDELGAKRVLRSVRDAADRDLQDGRGLRAWCFDRQTPRDAGRLVAARLDKQPYIDGAGGLFALAEGRRTVEARTAGQPVIGLGLAALTDGVALALTTDARASGGHVMVEIICLDDDGQYEEHVKVETFTLAQEVQDARQQIVGRLDRGVVNGSVLVERVGELFPRLRFGDVARTQIGDLQGNELYFQPLMRHLRLLNDAAQAWTTGPLEPPIPFSPESEATLAHGNYGPQRDFPTPDGFTMQRWSLHSKLGNGVRLYFRGERVEQHSVVLIGYFGPHLPTVRYR